MEYIVQLENGSFLEWGDDCYIFYSFEEALAGVKQYEQEHELALGGSVVNLFRVEQARWDNGESV